MQQYGKVFKVFFNDVQNRIMIENEIYFYTNGFLKWNNSKKTSYNVGNKKFSGKKNLHSQFEKQKKKYLCKSNQYN